VSGKLLLVFFSVMKEAIDGHCATESSKKQARGCLALKKRRLPNEDDMLVVCKMKLRSVSSVLYHLRRVDMLERTEHASRA
jgi:hypothetical protein